MLLIPELSVFVPRCDHWTHSCVLLSQCPQSPYYVSLQTEVRRRGRTRGSTSRMEGPGLEKETGWEEQFWLETPGDFLWSYYTFLAGNQIKNMFKSWEFSKSHCVLADSFLVQTARVFAWPLQVLNPMYCFPREEWRLRMTLQPYKMGEWNAWTDWKQSQTSSKIQ